MNKLTAVLGTRTHRIFTQEYRVLDIEKISSPAVIADAIVEFACGFSHGGTDPLIQAFTWAGMFGENNGREVCPYDEYCLDFDKCVAACPYIKIGGSLLDGNIDIKVEALSDWGIKLLDRIADFYKKWDEIAFRRMSPFALTDELVSKYDIVRYFGTDDEHEIARKITKDTKYFLDFEFLDGRYVTGIKISADASNVTLYCPFTLQRLLCAIDFVNIQ